jgi:nucleotide-binding universal stress UspA family protein
MNARGSTEVIVASIGLSIGALSENLYTMIVAMAVLTTMAMPPMLRWALGRLPLRDDERARLEREAVEARGFVSNLERLLVAADGSAAGKLASRISGLLVGSRGMPLTVLQLGAPVEPAAAVAAQVATETALSSRDTAAAADRHDAPDEAEVLTRVQTAPEPEQAIADEARKGYDLMVVGVEPTVAPEGGFHPEVARIAGGFEGPLALVVTRGAQEEDPLGAGMDILLPVTGTEVSRRGAEVALALARASGTPMMALYVSNASPGAAAAGRHNRRPRRSGEAILKEIAAMADQYGVTMRTAIRVNMTAEDAILRQARIGRYCLIVMGVTRRPGETLSFGNVAEAMLETSERSLLFVAS